MSNQPESNSHVRAATRANDRFAVCSAMLLRRLFRALPPALAYRLHSKVVDRMVGCGATFEERALFGPATIRSVMSDYEDVFFAFHGSKNFKGMLVAKHFVRPGDVVFEFGANLGTETLALAQLVGSTGRVIAAEVDAKTCSILERRVARAGLSQVHILNIAVADGLEPLHLVSGPTNFSGQTFVAPGLSDSGNVDQVTPNLLAERFGWPTFLFMDIEGSEYRALKGAESLLRDARPVIVTEVVSESLARSNVSARDMYLHLGSAGYRVFDLARWFLPEVELDQIHEPVYSDWLAIPRERCASLDSLRKLIRKASLLPRIFGMNPLDRSAS